MSLTDLYHTIRGQVLRAVVKLLDDSGPEQHVSVVAHAGQQRTSVPVHYPYGFSSHVPLDGAVTHVIQNGGDPSDLFAMPPSNPAAARMGGLKEGETVLYDDAGQRVHLRNGQIVEIDAAQKMVVKVAGNPVLTVTTDGVQVNGKITATGDVIGDGVSLKSHVHGGVQAGSASTGHPE